MQPLKAVLEVLRRHDVVVVLDGDLEEDLGLENERHPASSAVND